jgi:FixJ family two-component response regulator
MRAADDMVFVVDHDPAMRRSLRSLLRFGRTMLEVFASAQDFLRSTPPVLHLCTEK